MHPFSFEAKMVHFACNRVGRSFTERHRLTPARLDMLRVILQAGGAAHQSKLRHALGITKAVISEMVRGLESYGFVTRTRSIIDRRTFVVRITALAEKAMRSIYFEAITEGFLELMLKVGLGNLDALRSGALERTMLRLLPPLRSFRDAFGLPAWNPWDRPELSRDFYYADVPDNPVRWCIVPTQQERMRFSRNPPERIEDEPYQLSAYTGWPRWPADVAAQKTEEVRKKDAAVKLVNDIIRAHNAPR